MTKAKLRKSKSFYHARREDTLVFILLIIVISNFHLPEGKGNSPSFPFYERRAFFVRVENIILFLRIRRVRKNHPRLPELYLTVAAYVGGLLINLSGITRSGP